jgi:hypothetical protein
MSRRALAQMWTPPIKKCWTNSVVFPVLRIRDVYPGSFFSSRIPNPNFFHPGSRIRIKEFKYLTQKIVSKLLKIWSGLFIPDPDHIFLPIPDPGVKKAPDPGCGTLGPSISVVITWFLVKAAALATVTSARATLAESVLCSRATRLWSVKEDLVSWQNIIKKKILMNNHD